MGRLSLILLLLLYLLPLFPATKIPDPFITHGLPPNATWLGFMSLLDAAKGSRHHSMMDLKRYFRRFGYLPSSSSSSSDDDRENLFDEAFENALIVYQKNLGLSPTGKLDYDTMKVIVSPRCGLADSVHPIPHKRLIKTTKRYAYFYGQPRWWRPKPMTLTYAFSPMNTIDYISREEVRSVFRRSFERWTAVIPVNFTEVNDYSVADIRIGWFSGDHNDGEPFDGVLGVLAHAFSPENGRFHLDSAETWAVDFETEKSKVAVDLESVATHEIGHVLGLAHSSEKEAVMYPSLPPRTKKTELRIDDVEGIQALYGSNPNYRYDSRMESDISSGWGMDLETRKGLFKWTSAAVVTVACMFILEL